MEYMITVQPQHLWQLRKTFFIMSTLSLLDTRSENKVAVTSVTCGNSCSKGEKSV